MDANIENSIRQEQMESFGRLMAGLAHDMKNHLGIIRESNGLMGDILSMGTPCEDATMVARLQKSIDTIERRVVIAANMMHHLSGIAHRPDTVFSSFLVNVLIEEEYTFLERFSRLKQVEVVYNFGEGLPTVYNDPAMFQHVFYRVYSLCLDQLDSGQQLIIITRPDSNGVEVILRLNGNSEASLEPFAENNLSAAIGKLGGALEPGAKSPDHSDITLTIPSVPV
jgi:signal transduction histidine kinase